MAGAETAIPAIIVGKLYQRFGAFRVAQNCAGEGLRNGVPHAGQPFFGVLLLQRFGHLRQDIGVFQQVGTGLPLAHAGHPVQSCSPEARQ